MLNVLRPPQRPALSAGSHPYVTRDVGGWQVSAYRWDAAPGGVPVVFVNGMEERWDYCAGVAAALGDAYQAFSVELPWAGTQGNRWGNRLTGAAWIREALDLIGVDAPVVVAHSFGANAVLSYLDQHGADGIRAAVLVSPFYKRRPEDVDWSLLRFYVDEFQRLMQCGLQARSDAIRLSPGLAAAMAARVRDRIGAHGWLQFFNLFARTPELALERIDIPCLVIGGEQDFAATPDDCLNLAAALPLGEGHILPALGHFCMTEHPSIVASTIATFLAQHVNTSNKESHR
jgi:pimeloyl-ACP methyl ester carboxylesterase